MKDIKYLLFYTKKQVDSGCKVTLVNTTAQQLSKTLRKAKLCIHSLDDGAMVCRGFLDQQ